MATRKLRTAKQQEAPRKVQQADAEQAPQPSKDWLNPPPASVPKGSARRSKSLAFGFVVVAALLVAVLYFR